MEVKPWKSVILWNSRNYQFNNVYFWELFDRKVGIAVSDIMYFLNTSHSEEKEDVLTSLCAYVFIDTMKERLFHHRFLEPSTLQNKIYKYHDLRKFLEQIWYLSRVHDCMQFSCHLNHLLKEREISIEVLVKKTFTEWKRKPNFYLAQIF